VKVLVNITSDKCYENKEWVWGYRENDPMGGHDPYSASKGCAKLVFGAYLKSFFSQKNSGDMTRKSGDMTRMHAHPEPVEGQNSVSCPQISNTNTNSSDIDPRLGAASARAGNVIGGGDWGKDRIIPDCVRALSANESIGIRNPRAVRPWQHVLEPLSGYLLLGAFLSQEPRKYSGAWNFGPEDGSHLTAAEMADRLIKYWGDGSWEDLSAPQALHEANLLKLNCDKAHASLNWHSVLTIDECLQMTADWYKRFYMENQSPDIYAFCVAQIHGYMDCYKKNVWR
jgi:CDP-glucose 4,6-dehydratase